MADKKDKGPTHEAYRIISLAVEPRKEAIFFEAIGGSHDIDAFAHVFIEIDLTVEINGRRFQGRGYERVTLHPDEELLDSVASA